MIRVRNVADFVDKITVAGTQSAADNLGLSMAPFNGVIDAIYAKLGTAGVTGTQITDLKKNGTSIFSGSTKLNFGDGTTACTYGALSTNPTPVAKGDIIRVQTTQVNSGTPAKDLIIYIVYTRQRTDYSQGSMETDTLSSQSDTL